MTAAASLLSSLPELPARDQAYAVCAVRALGARAEALCARRSPALRRFAALLSADAALLRATAEALDRATPSGLDAVHPSWHEPPPPSVKPEAQAWLERRAWGHLVDLTPPSRGERMEALPPDRLIALVEALGRRRVAVAFSGAPRQQLARLCARLGEPSASALLKEVKAAAKAVRHEEARAAQAAVFQHVPSGLDESDAAAGLFARVGCGWLGPALSARGGDRLRRLAQRLPRPLGELLLDGGRLPASDAQNAAALAEADRLLAGAARGI